MSSKIDELRKVRYEHRKVAYTVGDLNKKLEMEPNRNDVKAMRAKLLTELNRLDLRRFQLLSEIKASPYALVDVVGVIDALTNIQTQIAHGGAEEGQLAISAFIRNITADKDRLTELADGEEVPILEADPAMTQARGGTDWHKLAGTRQGIITKLDKKVRRLEAELVAVKQQAA